VKWEQYAYTHVVSNSRGEKTGRAETAKIIFKFPKKRLPISPIQIPISEGTLTDTLKLDRRRLQNEQTKNHHSL
jgi:hypothetical protein